MDDAVVQDGLDPETWVPVFLHSDSGMGFTAVLQQGVCDSFHIAKTYSSAYCPQANGMVDWCNRALMVMLREMMSE